MKKNVFRKTTMFIWMVASGCLFYSWAGWDQVEAVSNSTVAHGNINDNIYQPKFSNYTESVLGINMQMVYVVGGEFMMGCTSEQKPDCRNDEKPVHRVTLDDYYIGKFEVTQGQWEKVMGTSISQQYHKPNSKANSLWGLRGVGDNYPMYYVSWEDATAFCEELSRRTGKKYHLPTEAQWEYAAREGNKARGFIYSGSSSADLVSWYNEVNGTSGNYSHPVGTKRDNLLGIHDMSGNVWEWCRDWYGPYNSSSAINPQGPSNGSFRVFRGGSYFNSKDNDRVSLRCGTSPDQRRYDVGFRVVREL